MNVKGRPQGEGLLTVAQSHATRVERLQPHLHGEPWALDVRSGDAMPNLQNWITYYVALVLELEGIAKRGAEPPAPPEAIAA